MKRGNAWSLTGSPLPPQPQKNKAKRPFLLFAVLACRREFWVSLPANWRNPFPSSGVSLLQCDGNPELLKGSGRLTLILTSPRSSLSFLPMWKQPADTPAPQASPFPRHIIPKWYAPWSSTWKITLCPNRKTCCTMT